MKITRIIMSLIVVAGLASSCGKIGGSNGAKLKVRPQVSGLTKATEITTGNIDAFTMDVVHNGGNAYIKGMQVKKSGSSWITYNAAGTSAQTYYWLSEVALNFWGFAPATPKGTLAVVSESPATKVNSMEFDYTLASSVTAQDDLLISYNGENRTFEEGATTSDNATIDVLFHHSLAKILFAVSLDDETFGEGTDIEAISLTDVSKGGSCSVLSESGDLSFDWTPSSETSSYTLSLAGSSFSSLTSAGDTNWAAGSYSKNSDTYNLFTTKESFFMIPDDYSAGEAKIGVTFKRGSETGTKYVTIADKWEAGKYYKYKITAQNAIGDIYLACELIVSDWVDGSTNIDL